MRKRPNGYYWIKDFPNDPTWTIGHYNYDYNPDRPWLLLGVDDVVEEDKNLVVGSRIEVPKE
jgi:hypothetical protein